LREGEVGILFIGAYHNVTSQLASDILLEMVKEPNMVKAYLRELFLGYDDQALLELGSYLASSVDAG
jgi:hypothetical protein